jgi:type IV secretory pathway TraG/TraD family ATPase VirD4
MAEGGGTGITTMPVLQSLSQARNKWGDHAASTIWDASIVKIILGGASASKDLQELSVLIGEREERSDTVSISDYGARSLQLSTRRVAVMPPERIRTLRFGTGLVLLRSAPPVVAELRRWTTVAVNHGSTVPHVERPTRHGHAGILHSSPARASTRIRWLRP